MLDTVGGLFSRHALERGGTRGIRKSMIINVLDHHDRDVSVGVDCRALSLTAAALDEMKQRGMTTSEAEGLRRLVIVWSDSTGQVVTAFRAARGRRAGRYLRRA